MTRVPTSTTNVDLDVAERTIAFRAPHPDVDRFRKQRANRAGHVCRECRQVGCVGEQREQHEREFAAAEASALLSQAAYFACPRCHKDVRTAPACRDLSAVA